MPWNIERITRICIKADSCAKLALILRRWGYLLQLDRGSEQLRNLVDFQKLSFRTPNESPVVLLSLAGIVQEEKQPVGRRQTSWFLLPKLWYPHSTLSLCWRFQTAGRGLLYVWNSIPHLEFSLIPGFWPASSVSGLLCQSPWLQGETRPTIRGRHYGNGASITFFTASDSIQLVPDGPLASLSLHYRVFPRGPHPLFCRARSI